MSEDVHQAIGRFDAQIKAMEKNQAQMMRDVREIRDTINKTKGGWLTILGVASVAATVSAAFVKLFPYFSNLPK